MNAKDMTRDQLIDWLAPRIVARRRQLAAEVSGRKAPPFYMLNVGHPAIAPLYAAYLKHGLDGTPVSAPPGDEQRTRFELTLLTTSALYRMAGDYKDDAPAAPTRY